ncbi:MAG: InlB B-repeat-containing protein, partial [Clostridia bacterium]|nr:InlB B-repeat-containing protein [Clostridia bacterium]
MKVLKPILSVLLVFVLVLSVMPTSAAETSQEIPSARGVHSTVIIDDDPTDGYEGDYVVIYNPSLSASNSISTGNLTGLIETTVEPNVMDFGKNRASESDTPYKIDVDGMLRELAESKPQSSETKAGKAVYNVGDTKTFEVADIQSSFSFNSIEFECLCVGEHCYIWTPVDSSGNTYPLDEIDPTYAQAAADEFDSKFDLMQSSFGNHDTSLDEKLHMLYYNIEDGWQPSQGYVAGFFYAYDIYNNDLPILNIDTYPGVYYMNSSGTEYKRIDDTFSTMVHEYQHLINYCNANLDTWLNECFSAAAEEICYPGSSVVARIQSWEDYYYSTNDDWLNPPAEFEYQTDFQLHNGYSMYNWSSSISDVLALYAQVSFFAQYLYTRFGNTIYHEISDAYSSSETNAITSATGVSCAELVRDFRIAVTANAAQDQYGGIYGFKPQDGYNPAEYHDVQNPYDLLSPIIFTGSSCVIKGGGAITVKPVGGTFTPPSGADSNLQYFGVQLASPYTVTAISNNEAWGTVSVEDTKITTVPAAGYYVADYEVVSGTATATIRGNIVRVTPESDCTIKVIFAEKPYYTVDFVASGADEGSTTAQVYDEITLPASVSVNPDGWTYIGWTETCLPEETQTKPVFYAPGAAYTVTGNTTLYAVYSRVEEGVGAPVYELVSEAPSDWSGNYVITYRYTNSTSMPMYVMKGVAVDSDGTGIEGNANASQYAVTNAVLDGTTLSEVSDDYLFTMEPHDSYYSMRNVKTGTYLGINSSGYFAGYKTYTSGNCDWKPGTKTNASSATVSISSSYPIISFYIDGPYFWAGSSNNSAALYVRFWKEKNGDATYYTTDPVVTVAAPAFKTHALALEGKIGIYFFLDLPQNAVYEYEGVDFKINNVDGADAFVPFLGKEDHPKNGSGYYQFAYYVRSIEMADTITATLKYKENGTPKTIEQTYSAKEYFKEGYDKNKNLFNEKQQAMTEATADYGHYLQAFLATQRTWKLGKDYAEMDKHYTDYTETDINAAQTGLANYTTDKTVGSNMQKITYTLVWDSDTELRVYFKPVSSTETFTFTVNGDTVTENGEKISVKKQSDGRYMVSIKNIAAHEYDSVYTVKAIGSDGVESVMTVSPLSYVRS